MDSTETYIDRIRSFQDTFPQAEQDAYEIEAGLYPDNEDPNYIPKLMRKKEFQDSKQESVAAVLARGEDRCSGSDEFELSSVQKFLARLLNPNMPYHSALVFHGVGVGKTCTAVTICESYLEQYPGRKAYVVAPPNIQSGFRRTLFDIDSMTTENGINHHRGCTSDIYLDLAGMSKETNRQTIEKKVNKQIDSRYSFFGYGSFFNWIMDIVRKAEAGITDERVKKERLMMAIRREFSNRVIVIDEAHNLRDTLYEEPEDDIDNPEPRLKESVTESNEESSQQLTPKEASEKQLTPVLKKVLRYAENLTLVLMTATPMYNSYVEIIFLLNLLLLNDKKPLLNESDVFDRATQSFVEGGRELLGAIASRYVSFMRGENPLTFPLRLQPVSDLRVLNWPTRDPKGDTIEDEEREGVKHLPCLGCALTPELEEGYFELSSEEAKDGLGITNMDTLVQAANWVYPGVGDIRGRIGEGGFQGAFSLKQIGSKVSYTSRGDPRWMLEENIGGASGKAQVLLERLRYGQGVQFVYSRFVRAGALSIALALEANGYVPYGRDGFLTNGNQDPNGMQCALCPLKNKEHTASTNHAFKQAKYVLLTGSVELSPNNAQAINRARNIKNVDGSEIKVILGSQIAGEGLDLRFIREVFVYDSWYHLNKLEQIIGRGIRTCSHAALSEEYRNCTITLLVTEYKDPKRRPFETPDMYSYRLAFNKAKIVGEVTRVLKQYALDCSLNYDAIVMKNIPPLNRLVDSQGMERFDVSRNDTPFSPLCDWLEECEYGCKVATGEDFELDTTNLDLTTYDEYAARYETSKLKRLLITSFTDQAFLTFEKLTQIIPYMPREILRGVLNEIIFDPDFTIQTSHGVGRIIYRNGYYLFQPINVKRESIPMAVRLASIAIPRDRYTPGLFKEPQLISETGEDTEGVWEAAKEWADMIRTGTAPDWSFTLKGTKEHIPSDMYEALEKSVTAQTSLKAVIQRIEMINWFATQTKNDSRARNMLADCVLDFIWDEFLSFETKKEILLSEYKDPLIQRVAQESYVRFEGNLYLRLLDESTFEFTYFCLDSKTSEYKECPKTIVEEIEKEKDPTLKAKIFITNTGFNYGFLSFIPKTKTIAFKKGEPPTPDKPKIGKGVACASITLVSNLTTMLKGLGETLVKSGFHDLGCNDDVMYDKGGKNTLQFPNSIRVCTALDIVLRFMDLAKADKKRWFYRAIEAKAQGHPIK